MIPWWNRKENARAALWISLAGAFTGWGVTVASLAWRQVLTPGPIFGLAAILVASVATWYSNGGRLDSEANISGAALRRLQRLQRARGLTDEQLEEVLGGKIEDFPASAEDLIARQIEGLK